MPGKFNTNKIPAGGKAAAGKATPKRPPARKSRYAGVKANVPRDPMLDVGEYRLRVLMNEETRADYAGAKTWYRANLQVVACIGDDATPEGSEVVAVFGVETVAGLGEAKSYVMAAAGFEDEGEYDEFDPEGEHIDATVGEVNEYSADGPPLVGRLVDVEVKKGNPCKDKDGNLNGDYYRKYYWAVVPEEDQEG